MILNIIIWILLIVSIAVILTIIVKKFPLLASINIAQIQAERQAELKKKILSDKFKRDFDRTFVQISKIFLPIGLALAKLGHHIYDKLVNLQQGHAHANLATKQDVYRQIEVLLAEAEALTRKDDLISAEHKYIEVIGYDGKNFKAYELLADNYFSRDNFEEAEQTLLHVIKLKTQLIKNTKYGITNIDLAKNYFSLALIYQKINENDKALQYLQEALVLEAANPKYLDKIIEVCIMMKDETQAATYCKQLELSNPSNKKLKEIKDKIRELEGEREN